MSWEITYGKSKSLLYNGRSIHSPRDPEQEGERFAKTFLSGRPLSTWNFFLGIGLGYHVKAFYDLLKKGNVEPIRMVCVFLDAKERHYFEEQWGMELALNSQEWQFLELSHTESLHRILQELVASVSRQHIAIVEYYPIIRLAQDRYTEFRQKLQEWLAYEVQNLATVEYFSSSWAKNFIYNLPYYFSSTALKLSGDVVLVSAGPSLRDNLDFLREQRGKVPIACVDTALETLWEAEIVPNIVLSCDAQVDNYYDFFGVYAHQQTLYENNVVLIGNMVQYHEIPPLFSKHILFPSQGILEDWRSILLDSKQPTIISGGSVASFALSALYKLGAQRFILVGQDLENRPIPHVVSSPQHKRKVFSQTDKFHPFYNYMLPWLKSPDLPARTPMLENLSHWIRDFFRVYPVQGLHKDPVRPVEGLPAYNQEKLHGTLELKGGTTKNWDLQKNKLEKIFSIENGEIWVTDREKLHEEEKLLLGDLFFHEERNWQKSGNTEQYLRNVNKVLMQIQQRFCMSNK